MPSPSDTAPRATIVVSGRAEPMLLPRALASVLAQTERALEVLVLCPAAVANELRGLDDEPRTQLLHDDHGAPGIALNAALARARAPWAKVVHATDVLAPSCVARERAALAAAPDACAVISLPDPVDEHDQEIDDRARLQALVPAAHDRRTLRLELIERGSVAAATVLFSVEVARALGGFDAEMTLCCEEDLWLRLCHHAATALLPERLARVRARSLRGAAAATARTERLDSLFRLLAHGRAHGWRWPSGDEQDASPERLLELARAVQRTGFLEVAPFARELVARARAHGGAADQVGGLEGLLGAAPELARRPAWCTRGAGATAEAASSAALEPAAHALRAALGTLASELEDAGRERSTLDGVVEGLAADVANTRVLVERTRDVGAQVLDKLRLTNRLRSGAGALLGKSSGAAAHDGRPRARHAPAAAATAVAGPAAPHDRTTPTAYTAALGALLERHAGCRGTVLFAPTLRWSHELFQRPHQLALELARQGYLVLYVEGIWPKPGEGGFEEIGERLYAATAPLQTFALIDAPIVFFLSYNALDLSWLTRPRAVYELIDELEVFRGDPAAIRSSHQQLLVDADVVVATAHRLLQQIRDRRPDAILCPNGVDYEHFAPARERGAAPADLARLVRPGRPIVGYYGALATWLDYEMIRFAALARPELEFVLIGPDYDGSLARTDVLGLSNVHRLDSRPYAVLPSYLRAFDVATIPFVVNDVTESTSPIKLFEYMAAGKPVVTSAMHECRRYPDALIAEDAAHFVTRLDQALELAHDPAYVERLVAVARANTWAARVAQILAALDASARPRASGARGAQSGRR